ncbi:MAG: hypothetical protein WA715_16240 [Candidatus Acidiferrum sp.]
MNKSGPKILFVLALILALIPALQFYAVREIVTILLTLAVTVIVLLLTVFALLLFWEGARAVFIWLTPVVGQTVRSDGSALSRAQVICSFLSRR